MAACSDASFIFTPDPLLPDMDDLKTEIKTLMVSELMLPQTPDEIADDTPIFSPEGLGLDSVDALQLVVAVEKKFGLKLSDADVARETLKNVNALADAITQHRASA
ncbi:MAG: acyl carrier protein [Verrucomicrobiales bacterium]|nr:acyl carrier protein [Verrucomicrobiales bacterium]